MKAPIKGFKNLYYPKGSVTQFFGENAALYNKICVDGKCLVGHNGIDIIAPHGTPIFAVKGGRVVEVKDTPTGYGKHVRILTDETDGLIEEWTYGHLHQINVKLGEGVKEGEQIGLMGNTGFVVSGPTPYWKHNPFKGTHLHLGKRICKLDKKGWKYEVGPRFTTLNYNNGFLGSVDFIDELQTVSETTDTLSHQNTVLLNLLGVLNGLAEFLTVWGLTRR